MKTEHTQGPWKSHVAHELLNVVADSVVSVDGLHVADVASYGASIATRNANAHLIAAAPELLHALKCLVRETSFLIHGDGTNGAIVANEIRNAIATIGKAKGTV